MDALMRGGDAQRGGRRNRVVLVPRRWDQARERLRVTAANRPGAPRRARISRNTIAQGRPVVPAEPVDTGVRSCGLPLAHQPRGCGQRPAFPAPSALRRGDDVQNSGNICRGNEAACQSLGAVARMSAAICGAGLPGVASLTRATTAASDAPQLAASSRSSVSRRIAASASIGSPKAKPCAYSQPS
jgi:hypothetical protein